MQDFFEVIPQAQGYIIKINGQWDFSTSQDILRSFHDSITACHSQEILLDFSQAIHLDFNATSFILLSLQELNIPYKIQNAKPSIQAHILTFHTYGSASSPKNPSKQASLSLHSLLWEAKARFYSFGKDAGEFLNFSGLLLFHFYRTILNPRQFRWKSFLYHINESGFRALPVALLTAFIVSLAVSLQGAIELESMGAPLLSVDTTAKLALREMGPFILALVIAGRSSSSYTAQLGVMNITDEISAMRVMDFSIMEFLVLPRFLALVMIMPFMVFLADAVSIFAGMIAIKATLGLSFFQYVERFYETVDWIHFFLGIIKAPFFGAAIAMVGCFRGLQVRGDTEQVGKSTTTSVVNALLWCIIIDAIFSIIFARLDL